MLDRLEEQERRREAAKARARRALFVDMLKSYGGPLVVAAFITPLLSPAAFRLAEINYALLLIGWR